VLRLFYRELPMDNTTRSNALFSSLNRAATHIVVPNIPSPGAREVDAQSIHFTDYRSHTIRPNTTATSVVAISRGGVSTYSGRGEPDN
jgi:hypothetical protein